MCTVSFNAMTTLPLGANKSRHAAASFFSPSPHTTLQDHPTWASMAIVLPKRSGVSNDKFKFLHETAGLNRSRDEVAHNFPQPVFAVAPLPPAKRPTPISMSTNTLISHFADE
jgi:hypothetical protein